MGNSPRDILNCVNRNFFVPDDVSDAVLWRIVAEGINPRRDELPAVQTIEDAIKLLKTAKNIIVLTGAGVSVSCGIPDFRSADGIYSRLAVEYPNIPDPQSMFDIQYFHEDPRPFFKFAREIYPGQFTPSPSHKFIKKLEERGILLRNYTQNIDTLERVVGITRVVECHGSFATASCTRCKFKINGDLIREDIMQQRIPVCWRCNPNQKSLRSEDLHDAKSKPFLSYLVQIGIFKPDIVFFGEGLPSVFYDSINSDRNKCDLLIVIGSSLKVKPVAMIPNWIPSNVPQILINREMLHRFDFDVGLYGDADVIINQMCHM